MTLAVSVGILENAQSCHYELSLHTSTETLVMPLQVCLHQDRQAGCHYRCLCPCVQREHGRDTTAVAKQLPEHSARQGGNGALCSRVLYIHQRSAAFERQM
jgi:hypothetical protein